MEGARDIGVVSIPFTAGVTTGAVLTSGALVAGGFTQAAAASALTAAAAIIVYSTRKNWSLASIILMFYCVGIFCFLSYSSTHIGSPHHGAAAEAARRLKSLIASMPFAHDITAPLLTAFLTGDRSGLEQDIIGDFRASGASHILALSGLHLGVIYMLIRRSTLVLGHGRIISIFRCVLIISVSGFYVIMTGAGPSIIRAWLFIVLNEICRLMPERSHDTARTLLTALTIQLTFKPTSITELGFQLSYLAMCGIVFVYPALEGWYPDDGNKLLRSLGPARRIWQGAALAISCQLFTAPLAWMRFHTFPKFFLITNLSALPLTSGIMILAVSALILYPSGLCPMFLIKVLDRLVQLLLEVLSIISSM